MARVQALLRTRLLQGTFVAASALALAGGLVPLIGASRGQEAAGRQPGARALWQQAQDCFRRGDYETAAVYYQQARANPQQLSPAEQADLRELTAQNNVALQGLRAGRQQLGRAEEALNEGHANEARGLLRTVMANQYLSPDDRQKLNVLNERLRGQAAPSAVRASPRPMQNDVVAQTALPPLQQGGPVAPPPKADPKTLLGAARTALTKGDLDSAERLATDAKRAGSPGIAAWLAPWSDTPDKVLREVGVARARLAARNQAPTNLEKVAPPAVTATRPGGPDYRPQAVQPAQYVPPQEGPGGNRFAPAHMTSGEEPKYISNHVSIGDPPPAYPARPPAPLSQTTFPPPPPNPSAVAPPPNRLPPLDAPPPMPGANDPPLPPLVQAPAGNPPAAGPQPQALPTPPQPAQVIANPRQQLRQARAAMNSGRLDEAEAILNAINVGAARWGLFEDNPTQLRSDLRRTQAVRELAEARRAFKAGDFEEARARAFRAQQLHGAYSVWDFGDRPQYLLNEIARAEAARRRQLPPLTGPAKTEMVQMPPAPANPGNSFAAQGPLAPPKMGNERPTQAVAQGPLAPPVMVPAAPKADPAREQAVALLKEARALHQQGKLVEARQKVLQAKATGARFAPSEDGPDVMLLQLAAACDLKVAGMVRQAEQGVSRSADPGRYDRAQAQLKEARELAHAFGQDTARIDQKCELLALEMQLRSRPDALPDKNVVAQVIHKQNEPPLPVIETGPSKGQTVTIPPPLPQAKKEPGQMVSIPQLPPESSRPPLPEPRKGPGQVVTIPQPPPETSRPPQVINIQTPQVPVPQETPREHGLKLLEQARCELRAGQTGTARTLAVEAFNPRYGVQDDAGAVLRSIDAEEFNQKMIAANRAADSGFDAFYRHNFRQARAILTGLDLRMLSPDRQARLKEVMQTSDMNPPPQAIAQVGGLGAPNAQTGGQAGKVTVSDGNDEDFASNYRALEEVKFQQMRNESIRAQNEAMQRFRSGDAELALDILNDYLSRLKDEQLSPDRLVLLRRPVEDRLQKLRTLYEQRKLTEARSNNMNGHDRERLRQKLEQERHAKVADLVKQADEFLKDGKYQEALMLAAKANDLEPNSPAPLAIQRIATMQKNLQDHKRRKENSEDVFMKVLGDAEDFGPALTNSDPIRFDKDRWAKTKGRKGLTNGLLSTMRTKKAAEIERKLLTPVSPNFTNKSLSDAIADLQDLGGVNLIFDELAVREEGIRLDLPVSLRTTEQMSLKSTLEILLRPARMTYVVKDDCVWITTEQHTSGKLVTKTYSVADLVIPVENFTQSPIMSLPQVLEKHMQSQGIQSSMPTPWTPPLGMGQGQPVGQLMGSQANAGPGGAGFGGVGASGSLPGNSPVPGSPKGAGRTIEDLLVKLIQSTVHPSSWTDVGGQGTVQYFPLGMALVVNQTPNIQEEIEQLLAALRRLQDLEVAIEVRVIGLSEEFFEYMGMDFDLNIRTKNTRFQPQLTTQQFTPPGQINNFQPNGFVAGLTPAGTLTRDLGIPLNNSSFNFAIPPFGGFPGTLGADGGLALGLAFLSDIQVFMFMEAAQGDKRTNLMQAPKLTMFNGQTATINVTDFQFLLMGITPVNAGSLLFFAPVNTPVPLGIGMTVQPVVSADRRFVRLSLVPTITSIAPNIGLFPIQVPIQSVFPVGAGGTASGQLENVFQVFLQQPNLTTITISTTVTVPDGGTVVMGGVKTLVEARNEYGPPILSQIPYLSRLFRNTAYGRETRTLMLMVTPRIIINEEEEEQQVGSPEVVIPRQ